jgi:hypothetical protein
MPSANTGLFEDSWLRLDRAMMHAQVFTQPRREMTSPCMSRKAYLKNVIRDR